MRTFLISFTVAFVLALLLMVNIYQASTISQQQRLIREMATNPACVATPNPVIDPHKTGGAR
jgi:hypothetical protein